MRFKMKPNFGKHRFLKDGKVITVRAGETIDCGKEDIGCAIDKFEQLDPDVLPPASRFKLESRGGGYFDVIHPESGMAINSKALRKPEAETLAGFSVEEYDAKVAKEAEEAETARLATEKEAGGEAGEGDGGETGGGDGGH